MARSDTLRREIASLEDKKAGHAKVVAAQEKIAAAARETSRKKREQASRSKNASTVRDRSRRSRARGEEGRCCRGEGREGAEGHRDRRHSLAIAMMESREAQV